MFICACEAVTDRAIRAAIENGASTPEEIGRACGAGSRCGGCWPALDELLREHGSPSSDRPNARSHTAA